MGLLALQDYSAFLDQISQRLGLSAFKIQQIGNQHAPPYWAIDVIFKGDGVAIIARTERAYRLKASLEY